MIVAIGVRHDERRALTSDIRDTTQVVFTDKGVDLGKGF